MTINQNLYLQGIESVLTSNFHQRYIDIDPEANKCWRTSEKPDDTNVSIIFSTLNCSLLRRMEVKELLSIGEIETRAKVLKSISLKVGDFAENFFRNSDKWERNLRASLDKVYRQKRENLQKEVAEQNDLLIKTIKIYQEKTSAQLESMLAKKESVLKMCALDVDGKTVQDILEIAVIAFEHATQEETSLWVHQHQQLLTDLYEWIIGALEKGTIVYEDVQYIVKSIERGNAPIDDFKVAFTFGDDSIAFNEFQIAAYQGLLSDFLEDYDEPLGCYRLTSGQLKDLRLIHEDMTNGIIEGYEEKSLDEILNILKLKYFQFDRPFCLKCFNRINQRDTGVFISCGEKEIILKMNRMTEAAAKIIQHPFIRTNTYELNLSEFGNLFVSEGEEAERIFKHLIDNFPNLEIIWLPVPCGISQRNIRQLKKIKGIRVIHFDFTKCENYMKFASFYMPLFDEMQHESWKLCIQNTDHFDKDEAIKLLAHFPHSKSVSLEGKEDVTNDDVMKVCANLPLLESMTLNGCRNIDDAALAYIGQYGPNLKGLRLRDCFQVSNEGMVKLFKIMGDKFLQLDLGGTNVTKDTALGIAGYCKNINCLCFEGCRDITDASVKAIAAECKGMEYYDLKDTSVTDDGVKAIAGAGNALISISFNGCESVTEESISMLLLYCKMLRRVDIRGTAVSRSQVQRLQIAFPEVKILGN